MPKSQKAFREFNQASRTDWVGRLAVSEDRLQGGGRYKGGHLHDVAQHSKYLRQAAWNATDAEIDARSYGRVLTV